MTTQRSHFHSFISEAALVALFFGMTNLIGYAYMAFLGRNLSTADFGLFGGLFALLSLSAYASGSVQIAVSSAASNKEIVTIIRPIRRWAFFVALSASLSMLLVGMALHSQTGFTFTHISILSLGVLALFYSAGSTGLLIACGQNIAQTAAGTLGAVVRITSGVVLISFQYGATGALAAYLLNYLAIILACELLLSLKPPPMPTVIDSEDVEPSISLAAICAYSFTFAPFALDQLAAQLQIPSMSGDYTALATVAKVLFFGLYPLILVSYSRTLRLSTAPERLDSTAMSAFVIFTLSILGAVALETFSKEAIHLFYGGRYPEASAFLGKQALSIATFTIAVALIHGLIAVHPPYAAYTAFIGSIPAMWLYSKVSGGVESLVAAQVLIHSTQAFVFLLALFAFVRKFRSNVSS